MEESKYYTPELEEFYTGFECEVQFFTSFDKMERSEWRKFTVPTPRYVRANRYDFELMLENNQFRVKYLDKEDVESLGFVKRIKDEWIGWHDYYLDTISGSVGYFLSTTIHKPRTDNVYKIYFHRYLAADTKIETKLKDGESELVFSGIVQNKSELKKLMKMLQITT